MMGYRREIDGLRAIAVIPVILFHAGFEGFGGGFVGVDIFFVISGYLITSIILTQKAAGTFSLPKFYERRARRILPALFLVMAACIPFAWLWLTPPDMVDFAESLFATPLFLSNHLFLSESGYFGTASELKPLLHTWSLSVEGQYYILFPLFLLGMWGLGTRWTVTTFAAIAMLSFALAHWGAYNEPAAAFFLLPTRVWEIAVGAFIAFYFFRYPVLSVQPPLQELGSALSICI
jgi:peptidoglycan/LPS O-acetylase OafA/YrhL